MDFEGRVLNFLPYSPLVVLYDGEITTFLSLINDKSKINLTEYLFWGIPGEMKKFKIKTDSIINETFKYDGEYDIFYSDRVSYDY